MFLLYSFLGRTHDEKKIFCFLDHSHHFFLFCKNNIFFQYNILMNQNFCGLVVVNRKLGRWLPEPILLLRLLPGSLEVMGWLSSTWSRKLTWIIKSFCHFSVFIYLCHLRCYSHCWSDISKYQLANAQFRRSQLLIATGNNISLKGCPSIEK